MSLPSKIQCKRAYDPPAKGDGYRVLVDRLWPRGVKQETLALDDWCKTLAPSSELRQWFNHDPAHWSDFCQKYHHESRGRMEALKQMLAACSGRTLTLVYSAKDEEHNNAVALKQFLGSLPG